MFIPLAPGLPRFDTPLTFHHKVIAHAPPRPAPKPKIHLAVAPLQPEPSPYGLYDSVTPMALPANSPVAVYATGSYQVHGRITQRWKLWVDTSAGDPRADALDVEPGDATCQQAGGWAAAHVRLDHTPAIIYTMLNDWSQCVADVGKTPVKWWIADPTGTPHLVPGSAATQWSWGSSVDISETTHSFWAGR